MIRNKEAIIAELKRMIANSDMIAQMIYDAINVSDKTEEVKRSLIDLYSKMRLLVAERGPSKEMQELLDSPMWDKQSVREGIENEAKRNGQMYNTLIADYLSMYRLDRDCMRVVREVYLACETSDFNNYKNMQENLGFLYIDENCVLYNPGEAFVSFSMAGAENSQNPEILYGYAKSLSASDNSYTRWSAFSTYKRAAELGHEKAREVYAQECRHRGVCTGCGGKFKGLFVKKCSMCGKKKDY